MYSLRPLHLGCFIKAYAKPSRTPPGSGPSAVEDSLAPSMKSDYGDDFEEEPEEDGRHLAVFARLGVRFCGCPCDMSPTSTILGVYQGP